jgi:hypothetical protein
VLDFSEGALEESYEKVADVTLLFFAREKWLILTKSEPACFVGSKGVLH